MTKEELKKMIVETSKKASEEAKEKGLSKEETKKYVAEKIAIVKESNPISEEKTVKVRIPIDKLNPEDKEIIVGINGKYAKIVRGEETEVSVPVYEQLKNAGLV